MLHCAFRGKCRRRLQGSEHIASRVLTSSLRLRLAAFFVLYFSQGLPMGLQGLVIPAWLAANDVAAVDIAFVMSVTTLPWALKLLLGFVMDRYTFWPMGRRRIWIIGSQTLMLAILMAGALLSPTPNDIALLAAMGFTINMCASTHDVAVDGLAVDILREKDRPRVSAWMFGGQALGTAFAAVIGGMILTRWGLTPAYLAIAVWVVGAWLFVISVRERDGERALPWLKGQSHADNDDAQGNAWGDVLKLAFKAVIAPASLLFLPVAFAKGFHTGIFQGAAPLVATDYLGWEANDFGLLGGSVTIVAAIMGMLLGGKLGDRIGPARCLLGIMGIFVVIDLAALGGVVDWRSEISVIGFAIAWAVSDVLAMIFLVAVAMSLCDKRVSAVVFAIFMATSNIGTVSGNSSVGLSEALGGPTQLFTLTLVAHALGFALMIALVRSYFRAESRAADASPPELA